MLKMEAELRIRSLLRSWRKICFQLVRPFPGAGILLLQALLCRRHSAADDQPRRIHRRIPWQAWRSTVSAGIPAGRLLLLSCIQTEHLQEDQKADTSAGKRRDKHDRRMDHGRGGRSRVFSLRQRHSDVLYDVHGRAVRRRCR